MNRPALLGRFLARLLPLFALAGWLSVPPEAHAALPAGFSDVTVARPDGRPWEDAVGAAVSGDGRLFVWERAGRVWVVDPSVPHPAPLIDLGREVGAFGELGLTGFALDPAFAQNGRLYLFYTVDPGFLANCRSPVNGAPVCRGPSTPAKSFSATLSRIVRYTLALPAGGRDFRQASGVDPASRLVLLGESTPDRVADTSCVVTANVHGAGSLAFGTDGSLLASCGDGASDQIDDMGGSSATAAAGAIALGLMTSADDVGSFRAQRVDSLSGKVLRLDPLTGNGLASNPFYAADAPRAARSRVWALGLRNPQRFAVRPGSGLADPAVGQPGALYIGDAGRYAWESLEVARSGRDNFGWPLFEGMNADSVPAFNAAAIVNRSAVNPLYPGACAEPFLEFRDLLHQDSLSGSRFANPCRPTLSLPAGDLHFQHTRPAIDWLHSQPLARWSAYAADGSALALSLGVPAVNGATVTGPPFAGSHSIGGTWYEGSDFPSAWSHVYFHADAGAGWIKAFRFDINDNPQSVADFIDGAGTIRGLAAGPSGGLYYVTATGGSTSTVHHVSYRSPVPAAASAQAFAGASGTLLAGATRNALLLEKTTSVVNPLTGTDVGAVTTPGTYSFDGTTYTLSGASTDIFGTADALQFYQLPLAGDGSITALVKTNSAPSPWTKAGVMIRETPNAAASNAFVAISGANGAVMTYRAGTGASTVSVHGPAAVAAPYWVRLTRNGSLYTGAISVDGLTWTTITQATVGMASNVYAGLAMTSHGLTPATATFGSLTIVSAPAAPSGLTVTQANTAAVLKWTASAAGTNPVAGYLVYRSDQATPLATVTNGTTYTDPTPGPGVTYGYYVVAFDTTTPTPFNSAPSASVAFKLTGAALPPGAPVNLTASYQTPALLTLTWTAAVAGTNPIAGYAIYRSNGSTPITSVAGLTPLATSTTTSYTDTSVAAGAQYTYTVVAYDNATPTAHASAPATSLALTVPNGIALSGGDVGTTGAPGSFALAGTTLTENGAGADIWNTADAFQFVAQPFVGDGTLTARVVSLTNTNAWAKAGVMIRETQSAGATHAFMALTPGNGANLQYRPATNGISYNVVGPLVSTPYWVRLTRAGNVFTGFVSPDGSNWTKVGQQSFTMATNAYAGFAVTSHAAGTLATASFDSISFSGGGLVAPAPPTGLAATSVGTNSITLGWTASARGTNPVAGYYVYKNGATTPVVVATTSFTDSNVAAGVTYTYAVAAYDTLAPLPLVSAQATTTVTAAAGAATPPAAPLTLNASAAGPTSIALAWPASVAGSRPIAGYYIYRNGVLVTALNGSSATNSYVDTGLSPATAYTYTVAAYDSSTPPLVSAVTPAASATTSAPITGPGAPSALALSLVTPNTATFSFSAATAGSDPIGGYYVYRTPGAAPITSLAGLTPLATLAAAATGYTDTSLVPGTSYSYTVAAFDTATPTPNVSSPAPALNLTTPASQALSSGDIGATGAAGGDTVSGTTLTVNGAGADIWNNADAFQFVSQPFVGDGSLTARVTGLVNTNQWAKAGVMIRTSLASGSVHAYLALTPSNGANFQYRPTTNGISYNIAGPAVAAPYWVRITRAGNVFTGYVSPDGHTWSVVGQQTLAMPTAAYAGFAVTSHAQGVLTSATFDSITYSGGGLVAPSVPTALVANAVSATGLTLNWSASTPGTNPLGGYYVYRNGATTPVVVSSTSFTDSGLSADANYSYAVQAFDTAAPAALVSVAATITVQTTTGTSSAPQAPASLSATATGTSTVALSWPASVAGSNPIGGYYVYRSGVQVATVTGSSATNQYVDSGLTPATAYVYTVAAFDTAAPPLVSAPSPSAAATTQGNSGSGVPPGQPGAPTVMSATPTSVSLQWTAATAGSSPIAGYFIYRGAGATPIAAVTGTSYTDNGVSSGSSYSYYVIAFDSSTPIELVSTPSPTLTTVTPSIGALTDADVGATGTAGSATPSGSTYTVTGAGADIWGVADAFNYDYLPFTGDGTITAQVTSQTPTNVWAKAGVMFRESLAAGATNAMMEMTPGKGAAFQYRQTTGAAALSVNGNTLSTPYWVRVTRANGVFTGYVSSDGINWTLIGSAAIPMATQAYVGLAVTGHDGSIASTATFSSVTLSGPMANAPSLVLQPRNASLLTTRTQQFSALLFGAPTTAVTFTVDGVPGGSATTGTISATGLYTAPGTAGAHTIGVRSSAFPAFSVTGTVGVSDLGGVYTYHGDNTRSGQYTHEYALNSKTVAPGSFGKLFSCTVDGQVYAQPLYVANLAIGGGIHNVVFVATEHDSVYAIDADSPTCVVYWQTAYVNAAASITSVPVTDFGAGCVDIHTEIGITGTPVIDPVAGILYFVAATKESGSWVQRLHALDLSTGTERIAPVSIAASYGGSTFSPLEENQRPALALSNGQVYIGWASHCDMNSWYGWLMAYNASTLVQTAAFNVAPKHGEGGIWMSGGGPAIDDNNNVYVTTGNGAFDYTTAIVPPLAPNADYGESFLKLQLTQSGNTGTLAVSDFYTPSQNAAWTSEDQDISSSGVVVLPDGIGPPGHPNLVTGADKQSHIWLLDRSPAPTGGTSMGGFSATGDNVVQYLELPATASTACNRHSVFGTPSYWNGSVYVVVGGGGVMQLPLVNGLFPADDGIATPSVTTADNYAYPPPTTVISTQSGSTSGVLWTLDNSNYGGGDCGVPLGSAVLHAYDAATLTPLYTSATQSQDAGGPAIKFQLPVVANGHVYVGGSGTLTVYGLLP